MDFVKNALSFTAGMLAQMLIIQGNVWAGVAVYLVTIGFILCDHLAPKK
ncbi:hypothetical protein [Weissella confusa]|nr:hypothetical protein [Weissella confusa]